MAGTWYHLSKILDLYSRYAVGWAVFDRESKMLRFEILMNTGRERVNINGALNAYDVTDIMVRDDDRINAASVIALYDLTSHCQ